LFNPFIYPALDLPDPRSFPRDSLFSSPADLPKAIAMSYSLNVYRFTQLKDQIKLAFSQHNQNQQVCAGSGKTGDKSTQNSTSSVSLSNEPDNHQPGDETSPDISLPELPAPNRTTTTAHDSSLPPSLPQQSTKSSKAPKTNPSVTLLEDKHAVHVAQSEFNLKPYHTIIYCPPIHHNPYHPTAPSPTPSQPPKNPPIHTHNVGTPKAVLPTEIQHNLISQAIHRYLAQDYHINKDNDSGWAPPAIVTHVPPEQQIVMQKARTLYDRIFDRPSFDFSLMSQCEFIIHPHTFTTDMRGKKGGKQSQVNHENAQSSLQQSTLH